MIVISRDMVLSEADRRSLCAPRLLYDNLFRQGEVDDSAAAAGEFAAENAYLDPATWNFWRPGASPAELEVELETAMPADYALFAAHTLGTTQTVVNVEHHDGAAWVTDAEFLPGSDAVFALLFDEQMAAGWRVVLTGSTTPSVGVVQLGKALHLPRSVTLDHGPISLHAITTVDSNISEGGQWLGRSVKREGAGTTVEISDLPKRFVRDELAPFIVHARARPFGWVQAPLDYPAEVAYCWTPDAEPDIRPSHAGDPNYLDVSFPIVGLME